MIRIVMKLMITGQVELSLINQSLGAVFAMQMDKKTTQIGVNDPIVEVRFKIEGDDEEEKVLDVPNLTGDHKWEEATQLILLQIDRIKQTRKDVPWELREIAIWWDGKEPTDITETINYFCNYYSDKKKNYYRC